MAQLTNQQAFDLAVRHHTAGRLREAEGIYREILRQQPGNADAMHLLGLTQHQLGHHAAAIELIGRALALNPDLIDAYNNLGTALRSGGRLDEAIAAFRRAIAMRPEHVIALINLGAALKERGELDEAISTYERAIAIDPKQSAAHNNLARALGAKGEFGKAIAAHRAAIAIKPDFAEACCDLGNVLKESGALEDAVAAYHQAIALRPNFAEAHSNLGNALRDRGEIQPAIAAYRRAMELGPGLAAPCVNLGDLFREQGQFEEACVAFKNAVAREPANSIVHSRLAAALAELRRFDEANEALDRAAAIDPDSLYTEEARAMIHWRSGRGVEAVACFRKVVELAPERATSWHNLGEALRQIGRFDEAAECFRRTMALRSGDGGHGRRGTARAYPLLSSLGGPPDEAEMDRLRGLAIDMQVPMAERAAIGFALGKMLDDANRFNEAFAQYAAANARTLQMREAAGARYSSDGFARRVNGVIARFTSEVIARTRDWGESSELPVFIVGMPRSGTSLVEQIAASHPAVVGAGELMDIRHIEEAMENRDWGASEIKNAAIKQLDRLRAIDGARALRVIDKMPDNVERLGLIAALFPRARVIICRRDPRDTCLSCFFQRFSAGQIFSFDLAWCGSHHVQTDRLIAHWEKVLPLRMLEVHYEELVANLEGESRRIISFLDLPWDPACLEFHRTERTVQTASDWQVRQPIYRRSVGRWRNYEKHLGALLEALGLND